MVQILLYFAFHIYMAWFISSHVFRDREMDTKHYTSWIVMHLQNDHWLAKHFQCSKLLLLHHKSGFLHHLLIHNGQYIDSIQNQTNLFPAVNRVHCRRCFFRYFHITNSGSLFCHNTHNVCILLLLLQVHSICQLSFRTGQMTKIFLTRTFDRISQGQTCHLLTANPTKTRIW